MISCEENIERISLYIDGQLNDEENAALEAHMATCTECTRRLADFQIIARETESMNEAPPVSLHESIMNAVHASKNEAFEQKAIAQRWKKRIVPYALVGAAVVLLTFSLFFGDLNRMYLFGALSGAGLGSGAQAPMAAPGGADSGGMLYSAAPSNPERATLESAREGENAATPFSIDVLPEDTGAPNGEAAPRTSSMPNGKAATDASVAFAEEEYNGETFAFLLVAVRESSQEIPAFFENFRHDLFLQEKIDCFFLYNTDELREQAVDEMTLNGYTVWQPAENEDSEWYSEDADFGLLIITEK